MADNNNFYSDNEHAWQQMGKVIRGILGNDRLQPKNTPQRPTTRLPKPNPNERWNGSDQDWANRIDDNG